MIVMERRCGCAMGTLRRRGIISTTREAISPSARPAVHGSTRERKALTRSMASKIPAPQRTRARIALPTLGHGSRLSFTTASQDEVRLNLYHAAGEDPWLGESSPAACIQFSPGSVWDSWQMTSEVSRFCPTTLAIAATYETILFLALTA